VSFNFAIVDNSIGNFQKINQNVDAGIDTTIDGSTIKRYYTVEM
jgi:hypothetical protein